MRKRQALHRMIGSHEFLSAGARGALASRTRPSSDWRRRNTGHDAQAFSTRLPGGSGEFGLRPIFGHGRSHQELRNSRPDHSGRYPDIMGSSRAVRAKTNCANAFGIHSLPTSGHPMQGVR